MRPCKDYVAPTMSNSRPHTDIVILLDASGSMERFGREVVDSANKLMSDQAALPGRATASIWVFSSADDIREIMHCVELTETTRLDHGQYVAEGRTAFNQAVGHVIVETGKRYAATPADAQPDKRIFAIMTDGEENASQGEWKGPAGAAKVREMIEHQTNVYAWEFMFLAANMDAQATAATIGVRAGNAMSFSTAGNGDVSRGIVGLSAMITRSRTGSGSGSSSGSGPAEAEIGLPPVTDATPSPVPGLDPHDTLSRVVRRPRVPAPSTVAGYGSPDLSSIARHLRGSKP